MWLRADPMAQGCYLGIPVFQHSACAPKEPQEHELSLLEARVAGNGVQHKLLDLLGVVWPLPKDMLQQQAVIFHDLQCAQSVLHAEA